MLISGVVPVQWVRSDKDSHFTGSLAQNAGEDENLTGLDSGSGSIEQVIILSDQNLAWEVQFYKTDGFDDTDLDLDTYCGSVVFAQGDGRQVGGAGPYKYSSSYMVSPINFLNYKDDDKTSEMHIKLVNRSATSKNAGATGEVIVMVAYRPDSFNN